MKNFVAKLVNSNWFFVSLVAFVVVLPLSEALVSVFAGVVLVIAMVEDNFKTKWERVKKRKIILLIPIIFIIYFLSTLITLKQDKSFYDVQKTLFYLVFPLAFSFGKEINARQKRFVFFAFATSVLIAIFISLIKWKLGYSVSGDFSVHNISPISHIRFSFQLILVFWFILFFLYQNLRTLDAKYKITSLVLVLIYLSYLLFQQSLTGLVALGGSGIFFLILLIQRAKAEWQVPMIVILLLLLFVPFVYMKQVIKNFYNIKEIAPSELKQKTVKGNLYWHDFDNPLVENGNYVYRFVCEEEMRDAWNKVSNYKYDSIGVNGYKNSASLIRYLTSKGLRKDAEGVHSLSEKDIENIEKGMANVIYSKKFSLYPRIYQTVWEYYVFSKTGNSNNQSFSQRIEYARAAIRIIKENWLFGVGTGNWKNAFADAFEANYAQLDESQYASSHNQYLNYMVKFGIIGFLLIMFLLIYPIIQTKRYKDAFFLLFLFFMFLANFADSNLESHMGSSFFFFFYCLFLIGPIDYLSISKKS